MRRVSVSSQQGIGRKAYLLAKANSRAGVEGQEDKGVWNEILFHSVINEPVGVKLISWTAYQHLRGEWAQLREAYHRDPKGLSCGA